MLGAVLLHHLGQLVVHVLSNPGSSFLFLRGLASDDLGLDRTHCREGLHDGLGLELDRTLHQDGVEHTTRTRPRLGSLFVVQTQQLQTLDVGVKPILPGANIRIVITQQISGQRRQHPLVHIFSKVGIKVLCRLLTRHDVNLHAVNADVYRLRVFDLNLNVWLLLGQISDPHRGLVQRFVNCHLAFPSCGVGFGVVRQLRRRHPYAF